jgi:aldehyde dehydrogenase (NAD+)
MVNAGQTCIAPDYVYVHRDVADRFVELCRNTIAQRYGVTDALVRSSPDFPRMIHRRHAERVAGLIDDAVRSGAKAGLRRHVGRRIALRCTHAAA